MEKTLLVNDFPVCQQIQLQPQDPDTPLSMPFVHPYLTDHNTKSYVRMDQDTLYPLVHFGSRSKETNVGELI